MRRVALAALVSVGVIAFASPAAHAAFPGANGKIAFHSGNFSGSLHTINPDGTGEALIFPSGPGAASNDAAWSPDGGKIAFTRCDDAPCWFNYVNIANPDGTGRTEVFFAKDPAWSPDGTKLAVINGEYCDDVFNCTDGELFIIEPSGTLLNILTNDDVYQRNPVWLPGGDKIAFECETDVFRVCVINSDGTGLTESSLPLTGNWSPDGRRIAFVRNADIWVMKADGSEQMQLTTNPATDTSPVWSPDGQRIAFRSNRDGAFHIYTMNTDGSAQARLITSTPGEFDIDWQPLGAFDPYPRPGGATPLRVPLVPAYAQCTDPAFQHVGPLDEPSCGPPIQESSLLTTSTTGKGLGSARLDVQVGDPLTAEDEADVAIKVSATDVRNASGPIDYTGQVIFTSALQMTDRANGFGGVSGTTGLFGFSAPVDCTPSPDPSAGSSCTLNTTYDSLVAGTAKEGKRAVIATRLIRILDLGADGQLNPNCPPTCGTGDERTFLGAGVFAP